MEKKCECYEEEVQPYRETDYKPIIYIYNILVLVCRCDGDVNCVDHGRCSGWWYVCNVNVKYFGESTSLCRTPVLIDVVRMRAFCMLCRLCVP